MGRIERLREITKARIEAFLDSIERPEEILPQLEKEMAKKVSEAANAEAKALTAVKGSQRRLDEATGRSLRFEEGAKLSLEADDLETARMATAALVDSEKKIEHCRRALLAAETAYHNAQDARMQMQGNLEDLKIRKKEIIAKSRKLRLMKNALKESKTYEVKGGDDILEMVARMEAKVDQAEVDVEVQNQLDRSFQLSLESEKFDQKLRDAEVEVRLAELKRKYCST